MKLNLFLLIIIFISISDFSFAQGSGNFDRSFFYDYGKRFFCETHALPDVSSDSIIVLSFFRSAYNILPFIKTEGNMRAKGQFFSIPQVEIEFKNSDGIIKKREDWLDTLFLDNFDDTKSKTEYLYGYLITKLPSGKYSPRVELSYNDKSLFKEERLPEITNTGFYKKETISSPIFNYNDFHSDSKYIQPFVYDNDIKFSPNSGTLLIEVSYKNNFAKFNYSIDYLENNNDDEKWDSAFSLKGTLAPDENLAPWISSKSSFDKIVLEIDSVNPNPQIANGYNLGLLKIELPTDKIVPGSYKLKVWNSLDSMSYKFKVGWEDMPLSLKNPDYAVNMMYYILSDKEFEKMHDGSNSEMFTKLLQYWKQHDPTAYTPFNEAMAEYFRRVDYAFFNYQTNYDKDGAKTERGKIYILNGQPTKIDRNMDNTGKITENWFYQKQNNVYTFQTDPNGTFRLVKLEEINKTKKN